MAMAAEKRRPQPIVGSPSPRIAPPVPARSAAADVVRQAKEIGLDLFPWQKTAVRYMNALGRGDKFLYPEVAVVVARQNGKTELLVPHIVSRLRSGRRIMHTAQDRELPREVHGRVADVMWEFYRDELRSKPRFANGQEEIRMKNGGRYRLVAPSRSGARGPSNDDVILDEVREQDSHEFMAAAEPTLTASKNPQFLFLSNAGDDSSVVLNSLRQRQEDPSLAYLEWSAPPDAKQDDRAAWAQANPSIGHLDGMLPYLERKHESYRLAGTLAIFETEHLCRWVATLRERLVDDGAWLACSGALERPLRPVIAVAMDPRGERASIALAWKAGDLVSLRLLYDVTGNPIDTDRLGTELRQVATKMGVKVVGYDPYTDAELVKYVKKPEPVNGVEYANASAQFVNLVTAGRLRWQDCDAVTADLAFTAKKPTGESSFHAVRSDDERPITASLAAIRAVWLASGPQPATARVM